MRWLLVSMSGKHGLLTKRPEGLGQNLNIQYAGVYQFLNMYMIWGVMAWSMDIFHDAH
jgi:hypothetical protein